MTRVCTNVRPPVFPSFRPSVHAPDGHRPTDRQTARPPDLLSVLSTVRPLSVHPSVHPSLRPSVRPPSRHANRLSDWPTARPSASLLSVPPSNHPTVQPTVHPVRLFDRCVRPVRPVQPTDRPPVCYSPVPTVSPSANPNVTRFCTNVPTVNIVCPLVRPTNRSTVRLPDRHVTSLSVSCSPIRPALPSGPIRPPLRPTGRHVRVPFSHSVNPSVQSQTRLTVRSSAPTDRVRPTVPLHRHARLLSMIPTVRPSVHPTDRRTAVHTPDSDRHGPSVRPPARPAVERTVRPSAVRPPARPTNRPHAQSVTPSNPRSVCGLSEHSSFPPFDRPSAHLLFVSQSERPSVNPSSHPTDTRRSCPLAVQT